MSQHHARPYKGALIVLEGGDGVGKTTQVARLAARMQAAGLRPCTPREPGGTPLGEQIRGLLLHSSDAIAPAAEALLFMAARAHLVETVILPALEDGQIVILDRMFLSTYAYQGAGRQLGLDGLREANQFAVAGLTPHLTILLQFPDGSEEGMKRAGRRGPADRMEAAGDSFHARVADAFRAFSEPSWQRRFPEVGPVVAVSALGSEAEVEERLVRVIAERVGLNLDP